MSSKTIIYSRKRKKRPGANIDLLLKKTKEICPFCPGNENETPPEIFQVRNGDGWEIRIIPNKYPIVESAELEEGGSHEVVVETRNHHETIFQFNHVKLGVVLRSVQRRLKEIARNRSVKYISWFRNNGQISGATIEHAHAQIVALPFVPPQIKSDLAEQSKYYKANASCQMCDSIIDESIHSTRISIENKNWLVMHPKQSLVEFETRIVPREHVSGFQDLSDSQLSDLSVIMLDALKRIKEKCGTENHNMYLINGGENERISDSSHVYIVIKPKTAFISGFEWSSGIFVNPVTPEEACEKMRSVVFKSDRGSNEAI